MSMSGTSQHPCMCTARAGTRQACPSRPLPPLCSAPPRLPSLPTRVQASTWHPATLPSKATLQRWTQPAASCCGAVQTGGLKTWGRCCALRWTACACPASRRCRGAGAPVGWAWRTCVWEREASRGICGAVPPLASAAPLPRRHPTFVSLPHSPPLSTSFWQRCSTATQPAVAFISLPPSPPASACSTRSASSTRRSTAAAWWCAGRG